MATLQIEMLTSIGGEAYTMNAGETHHVEEELARVLCSEPADSPRAKPVGWDLERKAGRSTATREKRDKAVQPEADTDQ